AKRAQQEWAAYLGGRVEERVEVGGAVLDLVLVPPGTFLMGSPKGEKGHEDDEDEHEVEIPRPFYLGTLEVTVGQFKAFVKDRGYVTEPEADGAGTLGWTGTGKSPWAVGPKYNWRNPGFPQTDEHPVVCVSWNDAKAFCDWLGKKGARRCRLPT